VNKRILFPVIALAIAFSPFILVDNSDGGETYTTRINGVLTFSDRKKNRSYRPYLRSFGKSSNKNKYSFKDFESKIYRYSRKYEMDPALIRAVIETESNFNPSARSKKGAIGLMQLMPGTAKDLKVDPWNSSQNIDGGTRYLSQLKQKFAPNLKHSIAAYNAGWKNVEKYQGVPPFPETKNYVKLVIQRYNKYRETMSSTTRHSLLSPKKKLKLSSKKKLLSQELIKSIENGRKLIRNKTESSSEMSELRNLYN